MLVLPELVAEPGLPGVADVGRCPIGDAARFGPLVAEFSALCHAHGWRIVVLGCSQRRVNLWANATMVGQKLRAVPIGRDVVIDVATFDMVGRKYRNLRQAVQRTHNFGVKTEVFDEQALDDVLLAATSNQNTTVGLDVVLVRAIVNAQNQDVGILGIAGGIPSSPVLGTPHSGSIVRIELNPAHPLSYGMPRETAGFFAFSAAYRIGGGAESAATYAAKDVLLSGWLEGEQAIAGQSAVVEARAGAGRVVLLGFRVQHRGQSLATFRLLFNALMTASPDQAIKTR